MASEWEPPKWIHTVKISDTSFLAPKNLHHGKMMKEKEKEERERQKALQHSAPKEVPKQSILAVIQIQEFEELFDELFELENSKIRLIKETSKEIDALRQRIIYLTNKTVRHNPSKQSYFVSFVSFFSFGDNEDEQKEEYQPIIRAKFSDTDAMEEKIKQLRRTKIQLIQQTSREIDQLKEIIKHLEYINEQNEKGNSVSASKWNILWALLAAVAIGVAVPVL